MAPTKRFALHLTRPLAALGLAALAALGTHCASATQGEVRAGEGGAIAVPRLRARPSTRAMSRALGRISGEARRCLNAGAPAVVVRGDFLGETGEFQVERVTLTSGAVSAYAVETCVRVAAARARVRPFRDDAVVYEYTLRADDVPDDLVVDGVPAPRPGANPYELAANSGGRIDNTPPPTGSSGGNACAPNGAGSGLVAPTVTIQGAASPLELIRRESDAFQRCYEQACQRDHTVAGELEVRVLLERDGRVSRLTTRVHSEHADETLMELVARCVESHVRLIRFGPQAQANVETVARLQFSPQSIPVE